jgi:hypothetical protein
LHAAFISDGRESVNKLFVLSGRNATSALVMTVVEDVRR